MKGQKLCHSLIMFLCLALKAVNLSPVNSIQGPPKVDLACSHDCTTKQGFCENGGTCLKLKETCSSDSYMCVCPDGFEGVTCSEVVTLCKHDAFLRQNCDCENGATCRKIGQQCSLASYKCDCTNDFEGLRCEINKSFDTPMPQNITLDIVLSETFVSPNDTLLLNFSASTNESLTDTDRNNISTEAFPPTSSTQSTAVVNVTDAKTSFKTSPTSEPIATRSMSSSSNRKTTPIKVATEETLKPTMNNTTQQTTIRTTTKSTPKSFLRSKAKPGRGGFFGISSFYNKLKIWAAKHRPAKPCLNCVSGTCRKGKCVCNKGFVGEKCDMKCGKICQNGGGCLVENGVENCRCSSGFAGEFCETPIATQLITTTRPETTQEATKKTCYPNFICVNGECDKSVPESPKCVCEEGFTGVFCQDSCKKQCHPGGRCAVYDGIEKCICGLSFMGEYCNETLLAGDAPYRVTATEVPDSGKPLADNVCSKDMVCIHGVCDKSDPNALKCRCQDGYSGVFCDKACSRRCLNGGECRVSVGLEICACSEGFTGKFCEVPANTSATQSQSRGVYIHDGQHSSRFCAKNFECIHGVCDKTDPVEVQCLCYDGYIGTFCQTACSKRCKNGGQCFIMNGTETCSCPVNFTGQFCDDKRIPELKPIVSLDSNRTSKSQTPGDMSKRSAASPIKSCSKECLNGGTCVIKSSKEECKCVQQFHGLSCENKTPPIAQIFDAVFRAYFARDATVPKAAQDSDPRKCSGNFICQHGICGSTNPQTPSCICDKGYTGAFCHHECTLECQNDGVCIVLSDQQYCNCKFGFSGDLCHLPFYFDNPKPTTAASNDTSETTTTSLTEDAG